MMRVAVGLLVMVLGAAAQEPRLGPIVGVPGTAVTPAVATPVYDVVSIKENKSGPGTFMWGTDGDNYKAKNVTVDRMISEAYGFREGLIFGLPKWVEEERFDVLAKISEPDPALMKKVTDKQREAMLAKVLEERFGLKVHRETKTLGILDLMVAKDGLKLKETVPETAAEKEARESGDAPKLTATSPVGRGGMRFRPGMLEGSELPVAQLVSFLESQLNKTIVDQTGLKGRYDFQLKYAPEGRPETDETPDMYTALAEQLGLKLKADKGPVEALVVDVIKMPTEN